MIINLIEIKLNRTEAARKKMGYDALISHYQAHETQYALRMFVIGFSTAAQI